jgi:hypothetical protein
LIRYRGVCSEPLVITPLAQMFSHSGAQAVAQMKSQCALNAFIATTAPRTQMICNSVPRRENLVEQRHAIFRFAQSYCQRAGWRRT